MNSSHFRLILLGLALGVLLALIIAPQTRWLVRLQTLTALRLYHPFPGGDVPSYTTSKADDERHIQAVSANHPDDFDFQYAQAVKDMDSGQTVVNLRALEVRFPDRPALYANLLRYASSGLHWNRIEENSLNGLPINPKDFRTVPNDPAALAALDRDAAAGERLDPNNAYFAVVRAIGLFMAHRDLEGMAAVARAGRETEWREYVPEDVAARWRLHEAAFGDPGALPRSITAYDTLFPQYALLRALARLLLYKAVQAERAGRSEEGLQLREDLRRYGDLMRVQSTSLIGSLVGIAIAAIATGSPGGMMLPKNAPTLKPEQIAQRRLDLYCDYVTRIGHPEAAVRARAEEDVRRKVQALANPDRLPDLTTPIVRLGAWWLAGLASLANVLWLLVFGCLAAGAARLGRMKQRPSQNWPNVAGQVGAAIGLCLLTAFLVLVIANLWGFMVQETEWQVVASGVVLLVVAAFLVRFIFRALFRIFGTRRQSILWAVGLLLLSGLGLAVFWHLARWQAGSLAEMADGVRSLTQSGDSPDDSNAQARTLWLSLVAALAVPLLIAIVLSIAARVRRIPVSVGLVQGFRVTALPGACVLLLLYGGLLLGTVRQERVVNAQVWHAVHGEGPYLAAQAGQPWPGPVR